MTQINDQGRRNTTDPVVVTAIVGAIATIAAAYFSYSAGKETILIPIKATQTAEARQPPVIQTVLVTQPEEIIGNQEFLPTISALETRVAEPTGTPIFLAVNSTSTTSISITNVQDNDSVLLIEAPYKVLVKGTASITDGLYVYLVVYDAHFEYVQPDVIHTGNDGFEGYCYLGVEKGDAKSINKTYSIFAVITDKEYGPNDHLDRNTVKAMSNTIDLYRTR